jgi:amino acid permease
VALTDSYPTVENFFKEAWTSPAYKFPIMYLICLVLMPLCLIKDISKMRIASLFSICTLIYAIMVIIIECPFYYSDFASKHDVAKEINWFDITTGFDNHLNFFRGTATIFFAYTCHVGAFPVFKTLKNNVNRRINKVFMRSILLDIVIYISIGICGYLTQPIKTPPLIIYRDKLFNNDLAMDIARLGMAVNLILSAPANYNAFRLSVLEIVWGTNEVSNKQ